MAQILDKIRQIDTASDGSVNFDFSYPNGVMVKQIIVSPATATTTFDIAIIDSNDEVIYQRIGETGALNELLELPTKGSYTCQITNSTADEAFTFKVISYETEG